MKLLVNNPQGRQEIVDVTESGGYFDQSRVIWDERTDGELPAITLGAMVRNGNSLTFSQAVLDAQAPIPAKPETELEKLIKTLVTKGIITDSDASKIKEVKV